MIVGVVVEAEAVEVEAEAVEAVEVTMGMRPRARVLKMRGMRRRQTRSSTESTD